MHRQAALVPLAILSGIVLSAVPAAAAGKKKSADKPEAAPAVEKVLRSEVAGAVDRRGQLAETLKQQPDSPAARWQAGFVRDGNAWRSYDEPAPNDAQVRSSDEYRRRRQETSHDFSAQLDLANWCRKQGLRDREQAHLFAAASSAGEEDQSVVLRRLGFRNVNGVCLSPDDLREWKRLNDAAEAALKHWEARLNAIANGLSGTPRQRDAALVNLREMCDPSTIPAIEIVLSDHSEGVALDAVEALAHLDGPQASLALARQAVFSNRARVRAAAAASLKGRNRDNFVPALTALLATPVRTGLQWLGWSGSTGSGSGSGVLLINYVLARETDQQFQLATFHTTNYLVNAWVDGAVVEGDRYRGSRWNNELDLGMIRGQNDQLRVTGEQAEIRERAIAEFNERSDEINRRIGDALSAVSGRESSSDPAVWWNWWNQYSDLQQSGNKPVVAVSETEVVGNPSSGFRILSCFAAGTPVWTETGAEPIESIKVGDRVLAKDVETGELAYKPVLQTTVRPPKELTTLRFGDETIVCTGGHRFWSSGSGWIKARDLEPHTLLHTVTGNTPVWSAKKGSTAETYNLVVADFHTYFVGKTGVLCQDLLIPHSTDNVVPGLSRGQAVARK
jgi:hypothetical protein